MKDCDYHIIGDIVWVRLHQFIQNVRIGSYIYLQLIATEVPNPRHRPYLSITGPATNINSNDAVFTIDAFQYTSQLKDDRKSSVLPVRAHIPDNPRYKDKKKPIPSKNSYVSVVGFLSRIDISASGFAEQFHMDVDSITFLGRQAITAPVENGEHFCSERLPN